MTRDEVLECLTNLADQYDAALEAIEGSGSRLVEVYGDRVKVFSAAAELIRAGGWRPITEAPESGYITVGRYWFGEWETSRSNKVSAVLCEFTHYLPEPEPPAREDSKS